MPSAECFTQSVEIHNQVNYYCALQCIKSYNNITSWALDKSDISELGKCTSFCILSPGPVGVGAGLGALTMLAWGRRGSGLEEAAARLGSRLDMHTELFVCVGASRREYRIVCLHGSPFGATRKGVPNPYCVYY